MPKIINLKSANTLGDATTNDVKKGVIFTSENGIALIGTGSTVDNLILQTESGDTARAVISTEEVVELTATADDILNGKTAITEDGVVTGTFTIDEELDTQLDLLEQIQVALEAKVGGEA